MCNIVSAIPSINMPTEEELSRVEANSVSVVEY